MNFIEAVEAMQDGKKVMRSWWHNSHAIKLGQSGYFPSRLWEPDDFKATDWVINTSPEPPKNMTFLEAWEQAKQGKKITRLSWTNKASVVFDEKDGCLMFYVDQPSTWSNQPRTLHILESYIEATDWIVVED